MALMTDPMISIGAMIGNRQRIERLRERSGPVAVAWHRQISAQGEMNVFRKVSLLEINQRVSGPAIVAVFTKVGGALSHDHVFFVSFLLER
jgi:hypothetical protein